MTGKGHEMQAGERQDWDGTERRHMGDLRFVEGLRNALLLMLFLYVAIGVSLWEAGII